MLWMRFLLHLLPLRPSATISSATKALYRRQRQRHGSHQSPSFIEFPTQHTAQVLVLGLGHMASSNLEVFLEAATPHLPWRSAPMDRFPGGADDVWQLDKQKQDAAVVDYFTLEDLWEHYSESSAYGLSVPLRLQNGGFITQHFVPYLSAVQIYTSKTFGVPSSRSMGISDETSSDSWSDDDSTSAETKLSWDDDDDADASASDDDPPCPRQELQFHYTEWDPPYERIPLADKVSNLSYPISWKPEGVFCMFSDLPFYLVGVPSGGKNANACQDPPSVIAGTTTCRCRIPFLQAPSSQVGLGGPTPYPGPHVIAVHALLLLLPLIEEGKRLEESAANALSFPPFCTRVLPPPIAGAAMALAFLLGFLLGALALAALEAAAALILVRRLRRRQPPPEDPPADQPELPGERPFPYYEKQGSLWILEPEKIPKLSNERLSVGGPKETKDKKNVAEVFPAKKMAKIKGHSLYLSGPDGSQATIELLDCTVLAVSASSMPSRKWAKRYPIKLENKDSEIYNGSKVCYLYTDTSWDKESWCKALRIAATADKEKLNWHAKLSEKFLNYISLLNSEYPCFLKPPVLSGEDHEVVDRTSKTDGSSKVRLFLKKLAKKASTKAPLEGKTSSGSSVQGEKKILDKLRSYQGAPFIEALIGPQEDKLSSSSVQDTVKATAPAAALNHNGQLPASPDVNADNRVADEGTLCWNLLSSRLFFDAKMSDEINKAIKARIQRTLSNMRTPSYVGEITLTDFSLGELPPYVHAMRVLPLDLNELWAFEVDFEYSDGILLHIETRLEVQEPELQKDILKSNFGADADGEVDSDLLESIEQYGNQLKGSHTSSSLAGEKDEADASSQSKSTGWTSSYISRWKNILHSIADHVSQVPLSLAIRISSVRGTLRIHVKPPPSDQIWYGFTSMPDLEWDLESSVGDRKITNSHIATLIGYRFKASLRDSLVLPNCESISMPWMLAEKDDWVPCKDAPFIWLNHETTEIRSHATATASTQPEEGGLKDNGSSKRPMPSVPISSAGSEESVKAVSSIDEAKQEPMEEASLHSQSSPGPAGESVHSNENDELRRPLLVAEKLQEDASESRVGSPMYTSLRAVIPVGEQSQASASTIGEDAKRKGGRRARMMDFGKKMGGKLEEKRRTIEERGRHIVEKMRENARTNSLERTSS